MKEMARRALRAIQQERTKFEITMKENSADGREDFLTSADAAAQKIYIRGFNENFPGYGIIAEEDKLRIPCSLNKSVDVYFTVDPLDGTRAFARRQSHGIGTMVSLVIGDEVVAACVGDVMTDELYYYRPEGKRVHRVGKNEVVESLTINPQKTLREQYVLLRDDPRNYSGYTQDITLPKQCFKNTEGGSGSIGIFMARLWKSECGAAILNPSVETPWDLCPILGISAKLGFVYIELNGEKRAYSLMDMTPKKETVKRRHEILIIHESRLNEFKEFMKTLTA